jgi:hypothetical protein
MEDSILDSNKDERLRIRSIFANFAETGQADESPVVTDPNVNPFPDVPLPADFREAPLPPVPS